jgi:hypothetical protein
MAAFLKLHERVNSYISVFSRNIDSIFLLRSNTTFLLKILICHQCLLRISIEVNKR